jgi:phage tail-like protein
MASDPFHVFRFRVEFGQVQHGGFSRVKGLARETKVESRREGGVNDYEHKLATLTTYGNLILERGLADEYLWSWHEQVVAGQIERQDLTVGVHDRIGAEVWRFTIERAFPVKWSGTDLDAASGAVMVESVELAHHGLRRGT